MSARRCAWCPDFARAFSRGTVRGHPHSGRRRRDLGEQPRPAGRRGLAGRRVALEWRAQVLPLKPAAADLAARPGRRPSRRAGCASRDTSNSNRVEGTAFDGLGHFEGRSWTGLHRHALMTRMAFAWLQHLRLAGQRPTGSGKNATSCSGTATIPEPAGHEPRHHGAAVRQHRRADPLPALQTQTQATA
jgi:hypothetical protein